MHDIISEDVLHCYLIINAELLNDASDERIIILEGFSTRCVTIKFKSIEKDSPIIIIFSFDVNSIGGTQVSFVKNFQSDHDVVFLIFRCMALSCVNNRLT